MKSQKKSIMPCLHTTTALGRVFIVKTFITKEVIKNVWTTIRSTAEINKNKRGNCWTDFVTAIADRFRLKDLT